MKHCVGSPRCCCQNSRALDVIGGGGGGEVVGLLAETSRTGAEPYAERICNTLAAYSSSHGWQIPASFGIASLPEDVSELIRAADEALYAAKRAGENCVAAYPRLADSHAAPREAQGA
jgi:diguanylate cyclase (GGDEF)-like protein